jgi:hypothetical protein
MFGDVASNVWIYERTGGAPPTGASYLGCRIHEGLQRLIELGDVGRSEVNLVGRSTDCELIPFTAAILDLTAIDVVDDLANNPLGHE